MTHPYEDPREQRDREAREHLDRRRDRQEAEDRWRERADAAPMQPTPEQALPRDLTEPRP
jgi:hypothetical protein